MAVALPQTQAFDGTVTFLDGDDKRDISVTASQTCYNTLACAAKKPTALAWQGLPLDGVFHGKSYIYFYTDKDCVGRRRGWSTDPKDAPTALEYDELNDHIGSFMVWKKTGVIEHTADGCAAARLRH
ncbi:TPA: hypothetical protein N0F65_005489 [Lagenidium giganteum]|uniref:Uncharacterized protein n=1 Tax=Lagenidium giganteum TaxID=4803 RepID=A0AAV2YJG7_9STRA|nr:TPA: hypothetical protein N0F65_005489 [Lagenidium giganteum]